MFRPKRSAYRTLMPITAALLLSACGIKGGLYLAPNQLPNAQPPAGSDDAKAQEAARQQRQSTIPAAVLVNPATESPAQMILDGSPY